MGKPELRCKYKINEKHENECGTNAHGWYLKSGLPHVANECFLLLANRLQYKSSMLSEDRVTTERPPSHLEHNAKSLFTLLQNLHHVVIS